jgi:hypothetical protein
MLANIYNSLEIELAIKISLGKADFLLVACVET